MLIRLTRQMRVRAAIALAVVYSFCLIFPPVAFGFADGTLATHCLGVVVDRADSSNRGQVGPHEGGQHQGGHQHGDQIHDVAQVPQQDAAHDHSAMHNADMHHGGSQDGALVAPVVAPLVSSLDTSHHDDDPQHSPNAKHVGSCCGLFCSLAVATNLQSIGRQDNFASEVIRTCEGTLAGRGPSRIDRPPSTASMSS